MIGMQWTLQGMVAPERYTRKLLMMDIKLLNCGLRTPWKVKRRDNHVECQWESVKGNALVTSGIVTPLRTMKSNGVKPSWIS